MRDIKKILEDHSEWLKSNVGKRANLWEANLRQADLQGADLQGANLRGADLNVKHPPINDHWFISEILLRAASTTKQHMVAGLVRISIYWCWKDFLENCTKAEIRWAGDILCSKWPEFKEKFNMDGKK